MDTGLPAGDWSSYWYNMTTRTVSLSEGSWQIRTYAEDNAGNSAYRWSSTRGYRVDGTAPTLTTFSLSGHRYKNGNDYWVRPGDSVLVSIRARDSVSGLYSTNVRLYRNSSDEARSRYLFNSGSLDNYNTSSNIAVTSASNTYTSGSTREATFTVVPSGSSHSWQVQRFARDIASNGIGWNYPGMRIRTDGTAPTVGVDVLPGSGWVNSLAITPSFSDDRSGIKYRRYAWSNSGTVPPLQDFLTYSGETISLPGSGEWYLHLYAEDNVGNSRIRSYGVYRYDVNRPHIDISNALIDFDGAEVIVHNYLVSWSATDDISGFQDYRYRVRRNDGLGSILLDWSDWTSEPLGSVRLGPGYNWRVTVEARDYAGNVASILSEDRYVPYMDENDCGLHLWRNPQDITVRARPEDFPYSDPWDDVQSPYYGMPINYVLLIRAIEDWNNALASQSINWIHLKAVATEEADIYIEE